MNTGIPASPVGLGICRTMETNIIQRPILFSGPMVRAILEGRKTQTRRVIYNRRRCDYDIIGERDDGTLWPWREGEYAGEDLWYPCPYGKPGDLLWVREKWRLSTTDDCACYEPCYCKSGLPIYAADGDSSEVKWKPSIHMPKKYSRLWLQVTGVRVERLQDITTDDSKAEGCDHPLKGTDFERCPGDYVADERTSFAILWESINGKGSWNDNPWVWVVEFRMFFL